MALRKARPVNWTPVGCSDAVDSSTVFQGAMSSLRDLVADPSTKGIFVPRPASTILTAFGGSGIATPGFISALLIVGDIAYGMISTSVPPGKDVPFIYNLALNTFTAITGITAANTPNSPATSGAWTPPTMAVIGTSVIVTHPGFTGANRFGILNLSTNTWSAGNTAPTPLPALPTAVHNFAGRAWYAVGNVVYFSDILLPTTITNATQSLTCGDTNAIVALGGQSLASGTTGGIIESMIVFKSKSIFQITGDISLDTLLLGALSSGVGTDAPLSVAESPQGLFFISQHGLRLVDLGGKVTDVIGADGAGISVPFINAVVPSRIAAAFCVNTVRITVQNQNIPTLPVQEWWYNTSVQGWTGSHTFPASIIRQWRGSFVISPVGINSSLWQGDIVPRATSSYIENGNQLVFGYGTSPLPLNAERTDMNAVIESSIGIAFPQVGGTINFTATDENGNILNTVSKTVIVSAAIWGTSAWGAGNWGGTILKYQQLRMEWTKPLVFNQVILGVNGNAVTGFRIGTARLNYQQLGYFKSPQ